MSLTTSVLRELHHIHRQLTELTGRLNRGPAQIKAAEANHERLTKELEDAKQKLTKLRVRSDERQLQLQEREDRIKDWNAKLNSCNSNREYQALKEQIAADEQANNVLMGEILELLEEIDVRQEEITRLESVAEAGLTQMDQVRARVEKETPVIEADLARVNERLAAAEANLPAELRQDYFRIARARGEDALAPIDGNTCGSCYQVLTIQTRNELLLGKPVLCNSCGAILYLPEGGEGIPE